MDWFRWYRGTTEDAKFRVVARYARVTVRDVISAWALILEDAADPKHRGICERNEDHIAAALDFEDGVVEEILAGMEATGMVSIGIGAITVCNWKIRQFESDHSDPTAADRMRAYRKRLANRRSEDGSQRNAAATKRNVTRNVTAQLRPESDTESDSSVAKATAASPSANGAAPHDDADLKKLVYDRAKAALGKSAGGMIAKALNEIGLGRTVEVIDAMERERPVEARSWFLKAVEARRPPPKPPPRDELPM